MSAGCVRIVHYINQFFGGLGGEEKAGVAPTLVNGAAGPGRLIAQMFGDRAEIVATVICGDNYVNEKGEAAVAEIVALMRGTNANVAILGPAFDAGRYGVACVTVGHRVADELGISCVTALYPENPGVRIYRDHRNAKVYCLPTTRLAAGVRDVVPRMAQLAIRLASGDVIGPANVEGYVPRGIRRLERVQQSGAERAVAMLKAKMAGQSYHSELPYVAHATLMAAPPLASLAASQVAVISTAGVVPMGNPDRFFLRGNTFWRKYDVGKLERMEAGQWDAVHGGYSTSWMNQNPNLGAPIDAMKYWERQRVLGKLARWFYSIPGVGAEFDQASRMGREIAADLKSEGIHAALLVST